MSIIKAALARVPVDLLISDVRVANVLTGEIYPAQIGIHGGHIAAVEPPDTLPTRTARRMIDGDGRLAVPGLIDSHMHIESSMVTPPVFAEAALRRGTTTVAEDPHEIANVAGIDGVKRFIEASRGLPLDVRFLAPPCVPAAAGLEHSQASLGAAEIEELLGYEEVIGLAEVMDARAVIEEQPRMRDILRVARRAARPIEGHNPMLAGRELAAFVAAGVDSDHTLAAPERIMEKLRLGVTIQLQERYVDEDVLRPLLALPQLPATICIVTDDVAPDELAWRGHLDYVLRHVQQLGMGGMPALQAATINPARRLRLHDRGAIAPGLRADLVLVDDLGTFAVSITIAGGDVVVDEGRTAWDPPPAPQLDTLRGSLNLSRLTADAFLPILPVGDGELTVRVIVSHAHATTTEPGWATLRVVDGEPALEGMDDLALIAVIARGEAGRFTGFVGGLGIIRGAIATSYSHDSHNLTVIGRDRTSMATAANAVVEAQGGIAIAVGERIEALLPLPIAGLLSDAPMAEVAGQARSIRRAAGAIGINHPQLFMRLSTFTLPVSRGLRITDMGYVQADERRLVSLVGDHR